MLDLMPLWEVAPTDFMHGLFALIAFIATGGQAVNAASWPGTKRTGATGAPLRVLDKRLWTCLGLTAEHGRATFFRAADGAVVTQEQIAVAAIDSTLFAGAGCIASPGR